LLTNNSKWLTSLLASSCDNFEAPTDVEISKIARVEQISDFMLFLSLLRIPVDLSYCVLPSTSYYGDIYFWVK
jgi:hypothetical protein